MRNMLIYVDKQDAFNPTDFADNYPNCEVILVNSEAQLLRTFLSKIQIIDPDIYVGYNIISFFLETLLDRMLFKNVDDLSKITRLKKSFEEMKFGFKKNSRFEKLRNITSGRLVLDIEESMQEFVNEVDYDLQTLAKKYFGTEVQIEVGSYGNSDNKEDAVG